MLPPPQHEARVAAHVTACWQGSHVRVTYVTGTYVTRTCLHRRRSRVAFNVTHDARGEHARRLGYFRCRNYRNHHRC